jgi:hypothetical protein
MVSLAVSLDEGFDCLPQLVLGSETGSIERLALQQAENDLNLVQPTGRGRREVKLDAIFEFGEPVVVPFMGRIVIQDDVDFLSCG